MNYNKYNVNISKIIRINCIISYDIRINLKFKKTKYNSEKVMVVKSICLKYVRTWLVHDCCAVTNKSGRG